MAANSMDTSKGRGWLVLAPTRTFVQAPVLTSTWVPVSGPHQNAEPTWRKTFCFLKILGLVHARHPVKCFPSTDIYLLFTFNPVRWVLLSRHPLPTPAPTPSQAGKLRPKEVKRVVQAHSRKRKNQEWKTRLYDPEPHFLATQPCTLPKLIQTHQQAETRGKDPCGSLTRSF